MDETPPEGFTIRVEGWMAVLLPPSEQRRLPGPVDYPWGPYCSIGSRNLVFTPEQPPAGEPDPEGWKAAKIADARRRRGKPAVPLARLLLGVNRTGRKDGARVGMRAELKAVSRLQ